MTDRHEWRKATKSRNGQNCVEIAGTLRQLSDSKNSDGPHLDADIRPLLTAITTGTLARR